MNPDHNVTPADAVKRLKLYRFPVFISLGHSLPISWVDRGVTSTWNSSMSLRRSSSPLQRCHC